MSSISMWGFHLSDSIIQPSHRQTQLDGVSSYLSLSFLRQNVTVISSTAKFHLTCLWSGVHLNTKQHTEHSHDSISQSCFKRCYHASNIKQPERRCHTLRLSVTHRWTLTHDWTGHAIKRPRSGSQGLLQHCFLLFWKCNICIDKCPATKWTFYCKLRVPAPLSGGPLSGQRVPWRELLPLHGELLVRQPGNGRCVWDASAALSATHLWFYEFLWA